MIAKSSLLLSCIFAHACTVHAQKPWLRSKSHINFKEINECQNYPWVSRSLRFSEHVSLPSAKLSPTIINTALQPLEKLHYICSNYIHFVLSMVRKIFVQANQTRNGNPLFNMHRMHMHVWRWTTLMPLSIACLLYGFICFHLSDSERQQLNNNRKAIGYPDEQRLPASWMALLMQRHVAIENIGPSGGKDKSIIWNIVRAWNLLMAHIFGIVVFVSHCKCIVCLSSIMAQSMLQYPLITSCRPTNIGAI